MSTTGYLSLLVDFLFKLVCQQAYHPNQAQPNQHKPSLVCGLRLA